MNTIKKLDKKQELIKLLKKVRLLEENRLDPKKAEEGDEEIIQFYKTKIHNIKKKMLQDEWLECGAEGKEKTEPWVIVRKKPKKLLKMLEEDGIVLTPNELPDGTEAVLNVIKNTYKDIRCAWSLVAGGLKISWVPKALRLVPGIGYELGDNLGEQLFVNKMGGLYQRLNSSVREVIGMIKMKVTTKDERKTLLDNFEKVMKNLGLLYKKIVKKEND